jgi:hypothetical protein
MIIDGAGAGSFSSFFRGLAEILLDRNLFRQRIIIGAD